jgi:hypothetical protein
MNNVPVDHKPFATLAEELQSAAQQVEVGALYAHYKNPDAPYKVIGFAIWEETDEVAVLYEAQEDSAQRVVFARLLSVWLETVEWEGKTVSRFTKMAQPVSSTDVR